MKTLEVVMDIVYWKRQGLSRRQIAKKLGISRDTVKKYLDDPEAITREKQKRERTSRLDPYRGNIEAWLAEDLGYKATWIYDRLVAMGYAGGYDMVKRVVSGIKGERLRVAYMRFETEPGMQAQVDFGEFQVEGPDGTGEKLYLFSMILGYSRRIYAELVERCDQVTFRTAISGRLRSSAGSPGRSSTTG